MGSGQDRSHEKLPTCGQIDESPDVPVGHLSWLSRPGSGGQSPPRLSIASAISACGE